MRDASPPAVGSEPSWAPKIAPRSPQEAPRSPPETPSSRQDGQDHSQDRPKKAQERSKSDQERSWNHLGAILGHFGAILGSTMCVFPCVFQYFLQTRVFAPRACPKASGSPIWANLGRRKWSRAPQERPKSSPRAAQERPRATQERQVGKLPPAAR